MMTFSRPVPASIPALCWLLGISLLFSFGRADAQSLRDPTLPPIEAGLASTLPSGKALSAEASAMTIIVRNGRPNLVVGTRLYAQGQQLGKARIERISETEVWLREGGVLRKISQFTGIQRRTVPSGAVTPACAASSKKTSAAAPCADVQP